MKTYIITEQQIQDQFDEIEYLHQRALKAERFIADMAKGWSFLSSKGRKANVFISKLIDIDKFVDFEKLHPKLEERT
jgi:cell division protein FtsB